MRGCDIVWLGTTRCHEAVVSVVASAAAAAAAAQFAPTTPHFAFSGRRTSQSPRWLDLEVGKRRAGQGNSHALYYTASFVVYFAPFVVARIVCVSVLPLHPAISLLNSLSQCRSLSSRQLQAVDDETSNFKSNGSALTYNLSQPNSRSLRRSHGCRPGGNDCRSSA
jgi:hypothetical protein